MCKFLFILFFAGAAYILMQHTIERERPDTPRIPRRVEKPREKRRLITQENYGQMQKVIDEVIDPLTAAIIADFELLEIVDNASTNAPKNQKNIRF